jgi:hypothetical protein
LSFLRLFLRFLVPGVVFLAALEDFLAVFFTQRQDTSYAAAWSMEIFTKAQSFFILLPNNKDEILQRHRASSA